ncbi:hypothetical protein QA612_09695 [Evansella sp. AB-P1]|uniref:hypothetical protein n=1 Tax=Evansella sp. AB-P1 TaxID=3037653 RepID=UPI00241C2B32|nr:hypothetical protein [Evansella sp. AB-P1]MDG5787772.1 hypothetical protein [Evansella sp. AB-P1]
MDLSGIQLPFSVADVVGGGMDLIGLVVSFIVLAMALIFAPHLIDFVKNAMFSYKVGKHHGSFKTGVNEFMFHTKYKYSKRFRDGY